MRLRLPQTPILLAAMALCAGCASGPRDSSSYPDPQNPQEIKVFVTNLAFMDAAIYGNSGGGRRFLGRITGKKEVVFSMPLRAPTPFHLEIDFLAGPTCLTETLIVDPGDHLDLVIQNDNASWTCHRK